MSPPSVRCSVAVSLLRARLASPLFSVVCFGDHLGGAQGMRYSIDPVCITGGGRKIRIRLHVVLQVVCLSSHIDELSWHGERWVWPCLSPRAYQRTI